MTASVQELKPGKTDQPDRLIPTSYITVRRTTPHRALFCLPDMIPSRPIFLFCASTLMDSHLTFRPTHALFTCSDHRLFSLFVLLSRAERPRLGALRPNRTSRARTLEQARLPAGVLTVLSG